MRGRGRRTRIPRRAIVEARRSTRVLGRLDDASVRTPVPKPVPKLPQPKGADIKSGAA